MSANFTATITDSTSSETIFARCECCGMTEEYTAEYMQSVRNLYAGKFVCGLCSEAVKYEISRWGKKQRRIGVDEALAILMRFHGEFVASPSPTIDFISAIGEMFRRRLILDLPRVTSAAPSPAPASIAAVDGGGICAAAVIGGCLPALSGGVYIGIFDFPAKNQTEKKVCVVSVNATIVYLLKNRKRGKKKTAINIS